MTGRLDGKVAFITGVARGQGRSHAVRLAQEGADIIGVDLCGEVASVPYPLATKDDLEVTIGQVEALDRRIVTSIADVRDVNALRSAVDEGVAQLGRLDVVSANAGISSWGPLADLEEATWQDMIDINLTGSWHTAKVAIPHLIASGGGSIVFTSSAMGLTAMEGIGHYVTAKHGLVGLMRTLALEMAPHMIRVNSLHPTSVNTPMIRNEPTYGLFRPDLERPTAEDAIPVFQSGNALPVPWVEAVDVSNVLLFLASDEARYITGSTYSVDAGGAIR